MRFNPDSEDPAPASSANREQVKAELNQTLEVQEGRSALEQGNPLERMKTALKEARDERRETHSILSHYLGEALPVRTVQDAKDVVTITDEARARGMLVSETQRLPGSWDTETTELAMIRRRDRYVKSPSVRAMKSTRQGKEGAMGISSNDAGVDMAMFSSEAGMRKRERDLIDRQELDHYHRTVEKIAEKKSSAAKEETQIQNKKDARKLILGDRTGLECYRQRKAFQVIAAHYEHQRTAVDEMTRDQLLERRKSRILNSETQSKNRPGRDGW
jgi:hypothetical protein